MANKGSYFATTSDVPEGDGIIPPGHILTCEVLAHGIGIEAVLSHN